MKIYIMGPSGSGTTTLGKALSKKLGVPQEDSDNFFWKNTDPPYTVQQDIEELHKSFFNFVSKDQFILSGDVLNWGLPPKELLKIFTHVIYLYVPWKIREKRIRKRELERFGDRIKNGGDMHKNHEDFVAWASQYESENQIGRNKLSQKNFTKNFFKTSKNILEIEEDLDLENIINQSMELLNTLN